MKRLSLVCVLILLSGLTGAARADEPVAADATGPVAADGAGQGAEQLTFNFRYAPWQDVLDWFSEQAGLSLLVESPPTGTFNYRDARSYTPAEALDVINSVLLTKGYTLVRRQRMLVLVNLEDGIPPNLVPDVPLAELDERGEYELIRVLFPVWNMTPDQAAAEIQPLLGPQGAVVVLPQARQIQVTETAGRLRSIRMVINAVERPDRGQAGVREFELRYLTVDAAMPIIRQMLGIPDEAFSTPDGSLHVTRSTIGEKLLLRGTAQHAARLEEVLRLVDVPEAAAGIGGTPQLEVYPVTAADPESVLKVLEVLMEGERGVRLAIDPITSYVVAFARPAQHATIRATIDQMQRDARQVDVIALSNIDPQTAVLAINKLFGTLGDTPDPAAPRVDADITTRSLLVRGTAGQVEQIRGLLRKLGETDEGGALARSRENVRLLPLTGSAARSAVAQIEQIWPSVRQNRIRVVTPTATIPTYRPSETTGPERTDSMDRRPVDPVEPDWQFFLNGGEDPSAAAPSNPETLPDVDRQASDAAELFRFVADAGEPAEQPDSESEPIERPSRPDAPILVAPGPGGVIIASDDLEALDQFEELLSAVAGRSSSTGREYAVFYLKYSKATTIAEVLAAIFGGRPAGSDRGIIGDMASEALGGMGGALMGDLLLGGGGGSGSFSTGTIDIVPDARLNALVVHAKSSDLDTVEQLLKVLDQRTGPELVEAEPPPRPIQVYNTTAAEIAQIVQTVYQDRMDGSGAVMSPQDMMRMLRGGNNVDQQLQKMSIGIDERNNLLVVRAPDPLFEEVKALVSDLDQSLLDSPQTTRVVTLRHTNSAAVQKAVTSLLDGVSSSSDETARQDNRRGRGRSPEQEAQRNMRRQMDMMRNFQRMQQQMQRGGQGGGRGFPGGFPGGGGPGGGGGRGGGGRGD